MIAPQLGRAARATSHNTICTAQRTATCTRPAIANSLCLAHRPHQRRLSSSKASCPPDDGKDGSSAATSTNKTAHAARSQAVRGTGPRPTRSRKSKDAESQFKQDKVDAVFDKLPKVPSTNDMRMQRSDISISSFFSLHRPISLSKPFTNSTDKDAFDQFFEPASSHPKDPVDVMYTLSNTIDSLENASQGQSGQDLHWTIVQESNSNSEGGTKHLDGVPRTKTLEEIVGHLKPYQAPPAPEPWNPAQPQSQSQTQQRAASQSISPTHQADRAYKTTIVVRETTDAFGEKRYLTSATPMVQISTNNNSTSSTQHAPSTPAHNIRAPTRQHQPFLTRLLIRNAQYAQWISDRAYHAPSSTPQTTSQEEGPQQGDPQRGIVISQIRRERARNEMGKMEAISVKRQRKLKMKKHKYKKLMKRTRTLRRKLDRN